MTDFVDRRLADRLATRQRIARDRRTTKTRTGHSLVRTRNAAELLHQALPAVRFEIGSGSSRRCRRRTNKHGEAKAPRRSGRHEADRKCHKQRRFKMDMARHAGDAYLRVEDVRESGPVKATITAIEDGAFDKPVAVLSDDTSVQLNQSNVRTLIRVWGKNSDDWIGKEIGLSVGQIFYNEKQVDTIVIKPISPAIPVEGRKPAPPASAKSSRDELDDDIPF
jgi:hypothetical protein